MKKLFILLLSVVTLSAMAQTQKIALLEPRVGEGSTDVTGMEKAMVRGELRKAIVNHEGFEAFTRGDIDQMMKEQDFQRTGNVSEEDIHKLGEMSGADYICVSTLTKSNTEFYLEAYLIYLETGRMSNPASQYGELINGKLGNMLPVCENLAHELLGEKTPSHQTAASMSSASSYQTYKPSDQSSVSQAAPAVALATVSAPTTPVVRNPNEYVDLGLPSGTLWKAGNEDCGLIKYEDAMARYGSNMPTLEQLYELATNCIWTWTGNGYNATGPNNQTIYFPAEGYSDALGARYSKKTGFYWSSSPAEIDYSKMSPKQAEKQDKFNKELGGIIYCMLLDSKKKV